MCVCVCVCVCVCFWVFFSVGVDEKSKTAAFIEIFQWKKNPMLNDGSEHLLFFCYHLHFVKPLKKLMQKKKIYQKFSTL